MISPTLARLAVDDPVAKAAAAAPATPVISVMSEPMTAAASPNVET